MEKRLKTRALVWGVLLAIIVIVSALLPSSFSIYPEGVQNYFDIRIFDETSNTWMESLFETASDTPSQIPNIFLQIIAFGLLILASFAKPTSRQSIGAKITFSFPGLVFAVCSVFLMSRIAVNFRGTGISTNSLPQLVCLILYAWVFLGLSILCFSARTRLGKKMDRGIGVLSAIALIIGFLLNAGEQIIELGAQAISESGYGSVLKLILEEMFIMAEILIALRMLMIVNVRYHIAQKKLAASVREANSGSDTAILETPNYQHAQQISQPPYAPPDAAVYNYTTMAAQPNGNGTIHAIDEDQLMSCNLCGSRFRKQLSFCPKCGSAVAVEYSAIPSSESMSRAATQTAFMPTGGNVMSAFTSSNEASTPPSSMPVVESATLTFAAANEGIESSSLPVAENATLIFAPTNEGTMSSSTPESVAPASPSASASVSASVAPQSYASAENQLESLKAVSGQPEFINAAGPVIFGNGAFPAGSHETASSSGLHGASTSAGFHESSVVAQPGFVAAAGPEFNSGLASSPSPPSATQSTYSSAPSENPDFDPVSSP
jgi:hypothetical protein